MFEYVNGSHESYPGDQFTMESLILCFEGKYRVRYVRKKMKSGGLFWDVPTASVTVFGERKHLKSFVVDSNFLNEDIKNFLDGRSWTKSKAEPKESNPFPF